MISIVKFSKEHNSFENVVGITFLFSAYGLMML